MAKKDWTDEFVHHWKYYIPPARASPSDIEFIKKNIKEKILEMGKDVNILILGATPEYRNLCGELGIGVKLIDFKKYNYEFLGKEVKKKPKEMFYEGDWLDKVLDEKFDIILADNVINVMAKADVPRLLMNVSSMLKADGLFIARTYVRDKGEKYTGEEVIREYRKERKGQPLFTGTVRNLDLAAYNFKEDVVIFRDEWPIVEKLYKNGLIDKKEFDEFGRFALKGSDFRFFMPLREYITGLLSEFFHIKEIFYGKEKYLRDKLPVYVLGLK